MEIIMQISEKIRLIRQHKNLTQEEVAEKLDLAVNTYAKIERGETSIKLDKLQKLANIMNIDIKELIDTKENAVFNYAENCDNNRHLQCHIILTETQCAHELEKTQLLLQEKNKEILNLKDQITQLKEIILLMKKTDTK